MNLQRKQVYGQRQRILEGKELAAFLMEFVGQAIDDIVQKAASDGTRGDQLANRISEGFAELTSLPKPESSSIPVKDGGDACRDVLVKLCQEAYDAKTRIWRRDVTTDSSFCFVGNHRSPLERSLVCDGSPAPRYWS